MRTYAISATLSRWLLILAVVGALVACSKDHTAAPKAVVEVEPTEYEVPTTDEVTVQSSFNAYISPSVADMSFGGALRRRFTNQFSTLNDDVAESLITLIVHNSDVLKLAGDEDLLTNIFVHLLLGHNIVVVEPSMDGLRTLFTTTTLAYQILEKDAEGQEILEEIELEAVPGARQVFESFHEMTLDESKIKDMFAVESDKNGVLAEAFAVRGCTFHIVERIEHQGNDTVTKHETVDEQGNVEIVESEDVVANPEMSDSGKISDYSYGLVADMFTAWINDHQYYFDEYEESRERSLETLSRASESTAKLSLADIANVQKVDYTISADTPYDVAPKLPVTVRFEICSVYQEEEDCDYYCVYKNIRSYNQALDCGPQEARQWRTNNRFGTNWTNPYSQETQWELYKYYGPYMRDIYSTSYCYPATHRIYQVDGAGAISLLNPATLNQLINVRVEEYSPKNSIGSVDKTSGFSYGFDGGLSFGADTSLALGGNFSFDQSTTQTIDDLEIEVTTADGIPSWKYVGQNLPTSHMNLVLVASHDLAPNILRQECEVDQSWIWRVANPTGAYMIYDRTEIVTSLMYYTDWWVYTKHSYANQYTTKLSTFLMLPPPRAKQSWIRDVVPYSEEVNALLGSLHKKYWDPDNYEMTLPDTDEESRLSITQFMNDFRNDLEDKRLIWHNRGMVPDGNKYIFYFYKKGTDSYEYMEFEL